MKKNWWTYIVIVIVVLLVIFLLARDLSHIDKETSVCIGENSELYIQTGCHACEIQEEMFGDNYQYLNLIDCVLEKDLCIEKQIEATPTWIINNEKYRGVQSIETLKGLTGC